MTLPVDHIDRITVGPVDAQLQPALLEFAAIDPLIRADFSSLATLLPPIPQVWTAWSGSRVRAAAIDDGLAMTVAGDPDGIRALAAAVDDINGKMVIAGRIADVELFSEACTEPRTIRNEHFMSLHRSQLPMLIESIPLRIAATSDVATLQESRRRAIEEEYGVSVSTTSDLYGEVARSVARAVSLNGVAIWLESGHVAFTAQLIAKTQLAAMFGDLYTAPEMRGAGRATRALTSFCAWLMSESEHVTLRVGVDNVPAVRLYERIGFTTVAEFASSLRHSGPLFDPRSP